MSFQLWITFSPIADVTAAYYGVGDMAVNWLSLIFLVVCIPLGLVAAWLLDTLGLRTGVGRNTLQLIYYNQVITQKL